MFPEYLFMVLCLLLRLSFAWTFNGDAVRSYFAVNSTTTTQSYTTSPLPASEPATTTKIMIDTVVVTIETTAEARTWTTTRTITGLSTVGVTYKTHHDVDTNLSMFSANDDSGKNMYTSTTGPVPTAYIIHLRTGQAQELPFWSTMQVVGTLVGSDYHLEPTPWPAYKIHGDSSARRCECFSDEELFTPEELACMYEFESEDGVEVL